MQLYKQENKKIIFLTQNRDPFFNYLTGIITKNLDYKKGKRLLDLGCGAGRNLAAASRLGFDSVGVDIDAKSLAVAKDYVKEESLENKVKLLKADLTKITPGSLGKFDYCILQEVIEHVENYQQLIDFAHTCLKKGGTLFITTPNDPKQWNKLDDYANHVRRFTPKQVKKALAEFKEVRLYVTGFPFHRTILTFYDLLLKILRRNHQAKTFRKNTFFHSIYYSVISFLLKIDDLFTFTTWGTTIIAIAKK